MDLRWARGRAGWVTCLNLSGQFFLFIRFFLFNFNWGRKGRWRSYWYQLVGERVIGGGNGNGTQNTDGWMNEWWYDTTLPLVSVVSSPLRLTVLWLVFSLWLPPFFFYSLQINSLIFIYFYVKLLFLFFLF